MHRLLVVSVAALAALVLGAPAMAWTWPADGAVLRPFSFGSDPYAAGQHRGIDVAGAEGTAVRAPATGSVTFAGSLPTYGRGVTIETESGYAVTLVHLGAIGVEKGATVTEGAAVGTMGSSGTPEHAEPSVHLGVRRAADPDGYVDPLGLLPSRAAVVSSPAPPPVAAPAAAPAPAAPVATSPPVPAPVPASPPPPVPAPTPPPAPVVAVPAPPAPVPAAAATASPQPVAIPPAAAAAGASPAKGREAVGPGVLVGAPAAPSDRVGTIGPRGAADTSGADVTAPTRPRTATGSGNRIATAVPAAAAGRRDQPRPVVSARAKPRPPTVTPETGDSAAHERVAPVESGASAPVELHASEDALGHGVGASSNRAAARAGVTHRGTAEIGVEAPRLRTRDAAAGTGRSPASGSRPPLGPLVAAFLLGCLLAVAGIRSNARRIGGHGAVLRHDADLLRQLDPAHRSRVHDGGRGRLRTPPEAARP